MKCSLRALGLCSLALGLLATGALALAVATDYWLYIGEPRIQMENMTEITVFIESHSGLWRMCIIYPPEVELEMGGDLPSLCFTIGYGQEWGRVEGGDTTNSILRAIRKSSPVIIGGLLLQIVALALSTIGNTKKNIKTLIGAVLFISSALTLAMGVIFYISAVNDEVSHRKKPEGGGESGMVFYYKYGWAFFFAGASFILAMMAAVSNISLYLRRYPNLEDMVLIIPGLDKRGGLVDCATSSRIAEEELEHTTPYGAQNPTIIL